jgi:hypothetical protein
MTDDVRGHADREGVTLTATEWSVSASEKISTGQYENYEVSAFVSGDIPEGVNVTEDGEELETELNRVHARLMDSVQKAAENRERLPEDRDWTPGGVE